MERSFESGVLYESVSPLVRGMGYHIVELVGKQRNKTFHVNLVIYRDSGVGIADCTAVYRTVFPRLEVLLDVPLHLEVSSPGVFRKFKDAREFEIFRGMKVKVLSADEVTWIVGIIGSSTDDLVEIESGGTKHPLRYIDIRKAQLDYP